MRTLPQCRPRGFTLVELMIAVVVLGILSSMAYPAMTSFLQKGRRADAIKALTTIVQEQERYRSNRGSYAEVLGAGDNGLGFSSSQLSQISTHYTLSLAGVGNPAGFVSGYKLTATANATSPQASDANCATLSVKLEGALLTYLSAKSDGTDTSSPPLCWAR